MGDGDFRESFNTNLGRRFKTGKTWRGKRHKRIKEKEKCPDGFSKVHKAVLRPSRWFECQDIPQSLTVKT